jgi:hypothetical protein
MRDFDNTRRWKHVHDLLFTLPTLSRIWGGHCQMAVIIEGEALPRSTAQHLVSCRQPPRLETSCRIELSFRQASANKIEWIAKNPCRLSPVPGTCTVLGLVGVGSACRNETSMTARILSEIRRSARMLVLRLARQLRTLLEDFVLQVPCLRLPMFLPANVLTPQLAFCRLSLSHSHPILA